MGTYVQPAVVADAMLEFMDNLATGKMIGSVNRQFEDALLERKGQTFSVRKPPRFESQDGPVIESLQTINQGRVDVNANIWKTIPLELSGLDLTMNASAFDDWAENFLKPAASRLITDLEMAIFALSSEVPNLTGTPGTPPAAYSACADARELLTHAAAPEDDRWLALNPKAYNKLTSGLSSGFNPQSETGQLVKTGNLFQIAGAKPYETANAPVHTVGAYGGTPVTNGAGQVGGSLITNGWTTATTVLKKGDVITVADVYAVNINNGQNTGNLRNFVVTSDVTSDGSGNATIPLSPQIITEGAFKTVSAAAASAKTITVKTGTASTSYGQSLMYHRNAFGLVMASIKPPRGLKASTRKYRNLSVTITTGPDIMNYSEIWRMDIAGGVKTFWEDLACRLTN